MGKAVELTDASHLLYEDYFECIKFGLRLVYIPPAPALVDARLIIDNTQSAANKETNIGQAIVPDLAEIFDNIGLFTKKGFISPEISLSDPRIRKVLHSESKQVKTDIIKCLKSHLSPPPLSEIPPHDDPFPFSIVYYPPSKNLNFGVRQSFVCWDYYQSPQNAIPKYRFNPINPILFQTGYPHTNQINQMPQSIRTLFNIRIG